MINADDVGRMLQRNPSIVAYKSVDELIVLKEWFFDFDHKKDNRAKAIARVKALNSRGRLPHAIESTALLSLICLKDPQMDPKDIPKENDSNVLQLSYSMALIRFVNGLLDPLQQSNFAIPLHQLAKSLEMPSYFVELRHMATHENLPSLSMLRIAVLGALNWLHDHYWRKIEDIELDIGEVDFDPSALTEKVQLEIKESATLIDELLLNIKVYRSIRKQDLNAVYKFGNSTPEGLKYWKAMKRIKNIAQVKPDLVIKVLLTKDCLISRDESKSKKIGSYLELLYKLYEPLLEELGDGIKYRLLEIIITYLLSSFDLLDLTLNKELKLEVNTDYEYNQLSYWAAFVIRSFYNQKQKLIFKGKEIDKNDLIDLILENIDFFPIDCQIITLEGLIKLKLQHKTTEKLQQMLTAIKMTKKFRKFEDVESLDSILEETSSKKTKLESDSKEEIKDSSNEIKHYFFEPHYKWEPVAFGSIV